MKGNKVLNRVILNFVRELGFRETQFQVWVRFWALFCPLINVPIFVPAP